MIPNLRNLPRLQRGKLHLRIKGFPLAHLPCAVVLALVAMATPLPVAIGAGTPPLAAHGAERMAQSVGLSVEECVKACTACACRMSGNGWSCECITPR